MTDELQSLIENVAAGMRPPSLDAFVAAYLPLDQAVYGPIEAMLACQKEIALPEVLMEFDEDLLPLVESGDPTKIAMALGAQNLRVSRQIAAALGVKIVPPPGPTTIGAAPVVAAVPADTVPAQ